MFLEKKKNFKNQINVRKKKLKKFLQKKEKESKNFLFVHYFY